MRKSHMADTLCALMSSDRWNFVQSPVNIGQRHSTLSIYQQPTTGQPVSSSCWDFTTFMQTFLRALFTNERRHEISSKPGNIVADVIRNATGFTSLWIISLLTIMKLSSAVQETTV